MRIFPNEEHNALLLETKEETSPQYICHYCKVSSLIKKIPVDCEPEEVEIFVRSPKKAFTFRIPLEEISDSKVFLQYCYKNHFTFLPSHEKLLHSYLMLQLGRILENSIEKYENKLIGWYKYEMILVAVLQKNF